MKVKHQHKTLVLALYIAAIFYSLHYALTLYLASSYLERFISIEKLGIIYVLSAIFSIYTTFSISRFLNKYSNYKVFISSILAEIVVLVLLSVANSVFLAIPLFIIGNILANTVFLSLNISVSEVSKKSDVGVVRGVYFTILNFGILCAAYFSGVFFEIGSFFLVYLMSAFLLVPVLYIGHKYLDSIEEPHYKDVSFTKSLKAIYKNKDIYDISIIQFVLSCFYAGIVVYTAPYLRDVIGIPTLQAHIYKLLCRLHYSPL